MPWKSIVHDPFSIVNVASVFSYCITRSPRKSSQLNQNKQEKNTDILLKYNIPNKEGIFMFFNKSPGLDCGRRTMSI